jgi:4-aminobutyrate aminotransferase-like enzyme
VEKDVFWKILTEKYLDFASNIASCPLGYAHPELMNILKKYLNEGHTKLLVRIFIVRNI